MYKSRVAGYTYQAENICPNCTIESLKERGIAELYDSSDEETIRVLAKKVGIDYDDDFENPYDSSDFPKPILDINLTCGFDAWGKDEVGS